MGDPDHRDGSVGGRGEAPIPNPEDPRLGRLGVGCVDFVIYIIIYIYSVPWSVDTLLVSTPWAGTGHLSRRGQRRVYIV